MHTNLVFYLVAFTMTALSCQPNTDQKSTEAQTTELQPFSAEEYNFLTHGRYLYTHIVKVIGEVPRESYEGKVIDFDRDGTYVTTHQGQEAQGKWAYDPQSNILDLMPLDGDKRSQWKLHPSGSRIILMGTPVYGDSPYQMRWEWRQD